MAHADDLAPRLETVRELIEAIEPILEKRRADVGPFAQFMSFELRAPLSDHALDHFEIANSVRLPRDYRAFVAEIGNGGPGPGYGLLELQTPIQVHDPINPTDSPSGDDRLFIPLVHLGCGMMWLLVVQGRDWGDVCYFDEEGFRQAERRCQFLEWYRLWLDATLRTGRVGSGFVDEVT